MTTMPYDPYASQQRQQQQQQQQSHYDPFAGLSATATPTLQPSYQYGATRSTRTTLSTSSYGYNNTGNYYGNNATAATPPAPQRPSYNYDGAVNYNDNDNNNNHKNGGGGMFSGLSSYLGKGRTSAEDTYQPPSIMTPPPSSSSSSSSRIRTQSASSNTTTTLSVSQSSMPSTTTTTTTPNNNTPVVNGLFLGLTPESRSASLNRKNGNTSNNNYNNHNIPNLSMYNENQNQNTKYDYDDKDDESSEHQDQEEEEDKVFRQAQEAALYAQELLAAEHEKRQKQGPLGLGLLPKAQTILPEKLPAMPQMPQLPSFPKRSYNNNNNNTVDEDAVVTSKSDLPPWYTPDQKNQDTYSEYGIERNDRNNSSNQNKSTTPNNNNKTSGMMGASVLGGVAGLVVLGPVAGVVAAGTAAVYAAKADESSILQKAGNAIAQAGSAAHQVEQEHHILQRSATGLAKGMGWIAQKATTSVTGMNSK